MAARTKSHAGSCSPDLVPRRSLTVGGKACLSVAPAEGTWGLVYVHPGLRPCCSRAGQQSSASAEMSLGMGRAHIHRERLPVAQSDWGGLTHLSSIHPSEGTYPRPGAGTLSGHDRVLFYWEETSAQEVRCGRRPE